MKLASPSYCHVQFLDGHDHVDLKQLQTLFQQTAFWAKDRNIADLEMAIYHSHPVVTVWDQNRMIGFARATSDGVYRATINNTSTRA